MQVLSVGGKPKTADNVSFRSILIFDLFLKSVWLFGRATGAQSLIGTVARKPFGPKR